jgi:hypothetical protein
VCCMCVPEITHVFWWEVDVVGKTGCCPSGVHAGNCARFVYASAASMSNGTEWRCQHRGFVVQGKPA